MASYTGEHVLGRGIPRCMHALPPQCPPPSLLPLCSSSTCLSPPPLLRDITSPPPPPAPPAAFLHLPSAAAFRASHSAMVPSRPPMDCWQPLCWVAPTDSCQAVGGWGAGGLSKEAGYPLRAAPCVPPSPPPCPSHVACTLLSVSASVLCHVTIPPSLEQLSRGLGWGRSMGLGQLPCPAPQATSDPVGQALVHQVGLQDGMVELNH